MRLVRLLQTRMKSCQRTAIARRCLAAVAHAYHAIGAGCGWLRRLANAPHHPEVSSGRPKIMGRFFPATVTAISFCRFHGFVPVDDFRGKCLALREQDYRNVVLRAFIGEIMMPAIDSFLATWSPRVLRARSRCMAFADFVTLDDF